MQSTDTPVGQASDLASEDRRPIELLFHELLDRGICTGRPRKPTRREALEDLLQVVAGVGR
ncbi:hypothetical protein [Streptomyces sp. c-19]|uniref:hypothetical protein n=1 Tax=Streptomyces sp. c-19 TaxID=2789275 RepID=UPI00397F4AC3